ncbi:hypothetical protein [Halobellus sp. GM3]|uniref:hypothetical protein n=1 Tax=Halobellus sp. GM3 TaxID=3458410 RepID=UPI00403DEC75
MSQQSPSNSAESNLVARSFAVVTTRIDEQRINAHAVTNVIIGFSLVVSFWFLLGPIGLGAAFVAALSWVVFPAVVPVAIGHIAIVTFSQSQTTEILIVAHASLYAILLSDGIRCGWGRDSQMLFIGVSAIGVIGVLFLVNQTSTLLTGVILLGVIAGGAILLAQFTDILQQTEKLESSNNEL